MDKKGNAVNEKIQYSEELGEMLDELGISQSELGNAIGRSQKTISRYVLGETLPDEKTRKAIAEFIQQSSQYGDYCHMPSEEFAELLQALLAEFKGRITQEELAGRIGKYQKDISNYLYHVVKPDTKTQHDILSVFQELCCVYGTYISIHEGTGRYLTSLLNKYTFAAAWDFVPEKLGEQSELRDFVRYCLTLPYGLQNFIAENFEAFCDNYIYLYDSAGRIRAARQTMCLVASKTLPFDFRALSRTMDLFRQLSKTEQAAAVSAFEETAFVKYPQTRKERLFFRQTATYRTIISQDLSHLNQDGRIVADKNERNRLIEIFESYATLFLTTDADVMRQGPDERMIQEIRYKLMLTKYEWYVWMLFLIYRFQGNDPYDKIMEIIHD